MTFPHTSAQASVCIQRAGLGLGAVSAFGLSAAGGKLAFKMLWQIPLIAAGAVLVICVLASVISMWKVVRLDPADVFKGA